VTIPRGPIAALAVLPLALLGVLAPRAVAPAHAAPGRSPIAAAAPAAAGPAAPLPMLPVISRVHVGVARDHVLVVEDVSLERDAWTSGDLELYVAFGAPGAPRAFDAHILAVNDGDAWAPLDDPGAPLPVDLVSRRPPGVAPLLGRATMAGAVVRVDAAALRHALAPSDMAVVRVRTILDLPEEDARGARSVVVRLGTPGGTPLALRRIEVASQERASFITRAEATLCGPEADGWPLSVHLTPSLPPPARLEQLPLAPSLAVRHASDDLCVSFWTAPDQNRR
jgi:hypothetical protein